MFDLNKLQNSKLEEIKKHLLANPEDALVNLDETGGICIHYAAWGNYAELADFLINELKVNFMKEDSEGGTPLHHASYGSPNIVKSLLKAGAFVNHQDSEGNTPLHIAVFHKQPEIVEMLLDAGAEVRLKAYDGKTALDIANETTDLDLVKMLKRNPVK